VTQRLLVQASWVGALLVAWAVTWFFQEGFKWKHLLASLVFATLATSPWYFGHFTQWMRVSDFLHNPVMNFNVNSYLIYIKKYPYFNKVDALEVGTLVPDSVFIPNKQYNMPQDILTQAYDPVLILQGSLPSAMNQSFQLTVNHRIVAVDQFKGKFFNALIPLRDAQKPVLPNSQVSFALESQDTQVAHMPIALNSVILTGFLNPHTTLFVDQVQPLCGHQKDETICHLDVPKGMQLVELPALFYPGLLEVTLNDKVVPYHSVLHGHQPLVTIQPLAGERNDIKIKFVGLLPANMLSFIAWMVWLAGCVLACRRRV